MEFVTLTTARIVRYALQIAQIAVWLLFNFSFKNRSNITLRFMWKWNVWSRRRLSLVHWRLRQVWYASEWFIRCGLLIVYIELLVYNTSTSTSITLIWEFTTFIHHASSRGTYDQYFLQSVKFDNILLGFNFSVQMMAQQMSTYHTVYTGQEWTTEITGLIPNTMYGVISVAPN